MVWLESLMVIIIIEFTVPFKPRVTKSHEYKMAKYKDLYSHVHMHRYEANFCMLEVGAKRFSTQSLWALASRLRLGPRTKDHYVCSTCKAAETASI